MEMKLIQTCQLAAGDSGTSCFLMVMACRAVPVTDTGWDRSYIILVALGQLEEKEGRKSNQTQKKNTNKNFPNVFYLTGTKSDIVCFGSCCQLFINTLNTAEELSTLQSRVSLCEQDWSLLQIRAEKRRDILCPWGHAFAILHVAQ